MGREINRVPLDFDWPIGQTWIDYAIEVRFPPCPSCLATRQRCGTCRHEYQHSDGYSAEARAINGGLQSGTIPWPEGVDQWDTYRALEAIAKERGIDTDCPRCHGHGDLATPELREWDENRPRVEIPKGEGWQLWETVGDSPMSPVFATSDELVDWMTTNPWMLSPSMVGPALVVSDRDTAQRFVEVGWAPSMVTSNVDGQVHLVDGVTAVTQA